MDKEMTNGYDFEKGETCAWQKKELFLEFFTSTLIPQYRRLKRLPKHPFLNGDLYNSARIFMDVYQAFKADVKYCQMDVSGMYRKMSALKFRKHYLEDGKWSRKQKWPKSFQEVFDRKEEGHECYNDKDMSHFLRFLRNLFVHLVKADEKDHEDDKDKKDKKANARMNPTAFYRTIDKLWPNLVHRFYALVFEMY